MAEARKTTKQETVTTTVDVPSYTLELSKDEAEALVTVLRKVGGDRVNSPRKYISAVTDALTSIPDIATTDLGMTGAVYCRDFKPSVREPKVGDRVRVVKDDPNLRTGEFVGKVGCLVDVASWLSLPFRVRFDQGDHPEHEAWGCEAWGCEEVELVEEDKPSDTVTYAGVTYDLSEVYEDTDGDEWQFGRRGDEVRGRMNISGDTESIEFSSGMPLSQVVRNYGPLEKV